MTERLDCKDCANVTTSYHAELCLAENLPKPATYMRDPRSRCGPEGLLFEPKPTQKELTRWHPY